MLLFSAAFAAAEAPTSSFSGKVIDDAGNPVPDVNVMLSSGHDQMYYVFPWLETDPDFAEKEMSVEYSDKTDAAGLFRITELGEHLMLNLMINPFRPESAYNFVGLTINGIVMDVTQVPVDQEGFLLSLVPGASIKDVEIKVERRMSIRGQVLFSDGTPLRNTQVSLRVKGRRGERGGRTMLDNEGRFVKYVDRADTYTIEMIYQGQKVVSTPLKIEKGQHVEGVSLEVVGTAQDTVAAAEGSVSDARVEAIHKHHQDTVAAAVAAAKRSGVVVEAIRKYRGEGMWVIHPDTRHAYKRIQCATIDDALKQAKQQDANLVAINNAAEQYWLLSVFGKNKNYWIGLKAGASQWDNGEPVTYTNLKRISMQAQADTVYTVLIGKTQTWEQLAQQESPIRKITGYAILEKKNLIVEQHKSINRK